MSAARSFRSVFMVASCAGAALGCYLVSLRVASERAALEEVETRIVLAQRDIRLLQTEIGTRGRLAQLERWNVKVLALSAPTADQLLEGGFQLADPGRGYAADGIGRILVWIADGKDSDLLLRKRRGGKRSCSQHGGRKEAEISHEAHCILPLK